MSKDRYPKPVGPESAVHTHPDAASSAIVAGLQAGRAPFKDETADARPADTLESLRSERDAALQKCNELTVSLHDQMNMSAVLETTVRGLTKLVGTPLLIPPLPPGALATIPVSQPK